MKRNEVADLINQEMSPGKYEITFNGNSLSTGTYFYKLTSNGQSIVKKMILLK